MQKLLKINKLMYYNIIIHHHYNFNNKLVNKLMN